MLRVGAKRPGSAALGSARSIMVRVAGIAPGFLVCGAIALAASLIAGRFGGPAVLYSLVMGMLLHALARRPAMSPGLTFSAKFVLRLGVALLGARITFDQILSLGWMPVAVVLLGITSTLLFGQVAARLLGLRREFGALSAVAVAICGVSAAMAASSVLPKRAHSERETIYTALAVTALSTIAMMLYPVIVVLSGMSPVQGGTFLGATIHDVAQVVGAGYMLSETHGNVATFTKLLRVAMLVPVVLGLAHVVRNRWAEPGLGDGPERQPVAVLPWFLVAFMGIVALNSVGVVPPVIARGMIETSSTCLVLAIAAIGVRTSFQELVSMGWRPAALIVAETAWLAGLALVFILALGPA